MVTGDLFYPDYRLKSLSCGGHVRWWGSVLAVRIPFARPYTFGPPVVYEICWRFALLLLSSSYYREHEHTIRDTQRAPLPLTLLSLSLSLSIRRPARHTSRTLLARAMASSEISSRVCEGQWGTKKNSERSVFLILHVVTPLTKEQHPLSQHNSSEFYSHHAHLMHTYGRITQFEF
jgi:hypothetical protein